MDCMFQFGALSNRRISRIELLPDFCDQEDVMRIIGTLRLKRAFNNHDIVPLAAVVLQFTAEFQGN